MSFLKEVKRFDYGKGIGEGLFDCEGHFVEMSKRAKQEVISPGMKGIHSTFHRWRRWRLQEMYVKEVLPGTNT